MIRSRWDAALDRLPKERKIKVAEIGVWTGTMSKKLLDGNPWLRLYQIDRWKKYSEEEQMKEGFTKFSLETQETYNKAKAKNLKKMKNYPKRVKTFELSSLMASEIFGNRFFDMVFIDGLHSFEDCKADIKAWWPKIKTGGWIGGHDFHNRLGVKLAVYSLFGIDWIELDDDNTWWMKK